MSKLMAMMAKEPKVSACMSAAKSAAAKPLGECSDDELMGAIFNRDPNAPHPIRDAIALFLQNPDFIKTLLDLFKKFSDG